MVIDVVITDSIVGGVCLAFDASTELGSCGGGSLVVVVDLVVLH